MNDGSETRGQVPERVGKAAASRAREVAAVRRSVAYRRLSADPANELHAAGSVGGGGRCYLWLVVGGRREMRPVSWRSAVRLFTGGWLSKVGSGRYRLSAAATSDTPVGDPPAGGG